MTGYVIERSDGFFVVWPGGVHSYGENLRDAMVFATRVEAEQNLCPENEQVVAVDDILRPRPG